MNKKKLPANLEHYRLAKIEEYRRRKRRAGSFRWVIMLFMLLACAAVGYSLSFSPFFGVEQVIVSGYKQVSAERLRALSGIELGQNIFTVNTAQVEKWLNIEPWVKTAQVDRLLPRIIRITITERRPAAVLSTGQAFVEIDKNGLVLRRMHELDNLDLPILSGIANIHAGVVPGSYLDGKDIGVALTVLNNLPQQAFLAVKEIDVRDSQKIKLYTEGAIEVRIGGIGDIAAKYLLADSIIYDAQLNGTISQISYIDVSSTAKPVIY
ncbi:MAG: FtsQ-type POTRA domain-containing protein [Firmicutes bacterium]|nr:FtsQ-type POTRA domain-containing protein [Bacillota bacterium]